MPKSNTDAPETLPADHLSPNCYVPPPAVAPRVIKPEFGVYCGSAGGISPPTGPSDVPAPPSPLTQVTTESAGRLFPGRLRQEQFAGSQLCPALAHMNLDAAPMKPLILDTAKNAPAKAEAKDEASSPLILPTLDNTFIESMNKPMDRHISPPRANPVISVMGSSFTICCNHCDAAIPNVHWHCSSCDNGDFDLCVECVNKGVLCDSKDHWLIKRFVQNGKVTNSITEKMEPRKAPTIDHVLTTDAPAAKMSDCKANVSHEALAESRTCNSCVTGNNEEPPLPLFTHKA